MRNKNKSNLDLMTTEKIKYSLKGKGSITFCKKRRYNEEPVIRKTIVKKDFQNFKKKILSLTQLLENGPKLGYSQHKYSGNNYNNPVNLMFLYLHEIT